MGRVSNRTIQGRISAARNLHGSRWRRRCEQQTKSLQEAEEDEVTVTSPTEELGTQTNDNSDPTPTSTAAVTDVNTTSLLTPSPSAPVSVTDGGTVPQNVRCYKAVHRLKRNGVCLICCSQCWVYETNGASKAGSDIDVVVSFLLRRLFVWPGVIRKLEKKIIGRKTLSEIVMLCSSCISQIRPSLEIQKKIDELNQQITMVLIKLQNIVSRSNLTEDPDVITKNTLRLYQEIRSKLSKFPVEKKARKSQARPSLPKPKVPKIPKSTDQKKDIGVLQRQRGRRPLYRPARFLENDSTPIHDEEPVENELQPINIGLPGEIKAEEESEIENNAADYMSVESELSEPEEDPLSISTLTTPSVISSFRKQFRPRILRTEHSSSSIPMRKRKHNPISKPQIEVKKTIELFKYTTTLKKRSRYPCVICPEMLKTPPEAAQHRYFIHPGLSVCIGSIGSLECRKVFRSSEIKQHRQEAHRLFKCTGSGCLEAFSTQERRYLHFQDKHPDLPLPDVEEPIEVQNCVQPLSDDEIRGLTPGAPRVEIIRLSTGKGEDNVVSSEAELELEIESENEAEVKVEEEEVVDDLDIGIDHMDTETENDVSNNAYVTSGPQRDVGEVQLPLAENPKNPTPNPTRMSEGMGVAKPVSQAVKMMLIGVAAAPAQKAITDSKNSVSISQPTLKTDSAAPPKRKLLYKCGACNQTFKDQAELVSHFESVHNQKTKFGCYVCRKEFGSSEECQSHIRRDHPKPKTYSNNDSNPTKPKSVGPRGPTVYYLCSICTKRYKTGEELEKHKLSPLHLMNVRLRNGELVTCPETRCKKSFESREALITHRKQVHGYYPPEPSERLNVTSSLPLLQCPESACGRLFITQTALLTHRMRAHNLPKPTYPCPKCPKTFQRQIQLNQHLRIHGGVERTFKCLQCPKAYYIERELLKHVKYFHEKAFRPHGCKVCSKRFTDTSKLKVHLLIHFDDRPYLCSQCGKTFKTRNNLYIHGWSHDPDRKTKYSLYMPKKGKLRTKRNADKNRSDDGEDVSREKSSDLKLVSRTHPENNPEGTLHISAKCSTSNSNGGTVKPSDVHLQDLLNL